MLVNGIRALALLHVVALLGTTALVAAGEFETEAGSVPPLPVAATAAFAGWVVFEIVGRAVARRRTQLPADEGPAVDVRNRHLLVTLAMVPVLLTLQLPIGLQTASSALRDHELRTAVTESTLPVTGGFILVAIAVLLVSLRFRRTFELHMFRRLWPQLEVIESAGAVASSPQAGR